MQKKLIAFSPVLVTLILALLPVPDGLTQNGWYFFSVFIGVIIGLIVEPVPAALVGLTGVIAVAALGIVSPDATESRNWALSGFSNGVIWLIFSAFMFAMGYKKTGLGQRISLVLIKYLGKSTLGLGYAVAFSDALLSPFMPSNTARSAGTIYPIVSNIPPMFNSLPDHEPRKIGSYLAWVAMAATCVTSSMFLTALAPNLLAVNLINQATGIQISWGQWATVMVPVMLPLLLLTPLLTYLIFPPTQKKSPEAPAWATEELKKLGNVTGKEYLMLGLAALALVFWIFGSTIGINSTVAALLVLVLMTLSGIVSWDDIISNKAAWNVLVWFATLVSMASGLGKTGVLDWVGNLVATQLVGLDPTTIVVSLVVAFFMLHYMFASTTAHTTALLPMFMTTAAATLPAAALTKLALLLAGSLGVMGIITPFATGPSPIWYGSGYLKQSTWWGLGAIFGGIFLACIVALALVIV